MILRRVMEHVRNQNWVAVGIDFFIVVVGVYLGLQVQEWSEQQDDRSREAQIVADMLADLKIDRSQYANGIAFALRRVGAANASLEGAGLPPVAFAYELPTTDIVDYSFDIASTPDFPADQRGRLWTEVVLGYFPTPSTSTYDAIVGAGDIRVLRDRSLVRDIQLYRNLTGSVITQNEKIVTIRADVLRLGMKYGLAPYADMPAEDYYRLVASEPELAAAIRLQATFAIFHHGDIASADARAAQLQRRLENYLVAVE